MKISTENIKWKWIPVRFDSKILHAVPVFMDDWPISKSRTACGIRLPIPSMQIPEWKYRNCKNCFKRIRESVFWIFEYEGIYAFKKNMVPSREREGRHNDEKRSQT